MESAIPSHLRTERTRARRIPDDYRPPVPAYVARFGPAVTRVTMAYFGVQFAGDEPPSVRGALDRITTAFADGNGPSHWDRARYVDEAGFTTILTVAYWDDHNKFERWFAPARREWMPQARAGDPLGRFIEVLSPAVEGFETLVSSRDRAEGIAVLADAVSGEIQENAYWGGMRDRIPLSQTHAMSPAGSVRLHRDGSRIRVYANENLCLIRSGQDWSDTTGAEREMYLRDIEPVLREGMDFLRDDGRAIGCWANRYMRVLDRDGQPLDKSYGMSWWRSLDSLERWAESHPTHVAIFAAAIKYQRTVGPAARLRLFHEVAVARSTEQFFEYANCHDRTGLLSAVGLS